MLGVVLKEALMFPFQKVAGIEIQQKLLQTAQANFKIMGIDDQIECIHADAVNFEKYGDYNVFFFFNPFSEEILQRVTDKIFRSRNEGENVVTVIYHNPQFQRIFETNAQVLKKITLHDDMKDYDTCILELDISVYCKKSINPER